MLFLTVFFVTELLRLLKPNIYWTKHILDKRLDEQPFEFKPVLNSFRKGRNIGSNPVNCLGKFLPSKLE